MFKVLAKQETLHYACSNYKTTDVFSNTLLLKEAAVVTAFL